MPNHRVNEIWMGESVTTLEDLLRPGLRAVCVGIQPSLVSVEAGHYYQGRSGRRFFQRLRGAGVLPEAKRGEKDDAAFRLELWVPAGESCQNERRFVMPGPYESAATAAPTLGALADRFDQARPERSRLKATGGRCRDCPVFSRLLRLS